MSLDTLESLMKELGNDFAILKAGVAGLINENKRLKQENKELKEKLG